MIVFGEPKKSAFVTAAGGEGSRSEIFDAAYDAALVTDNMNAATTALEKAYDARIDKIYQATGQKLDNPMYHDWRGSLAAGIDTVMRKADIGLRVNIPSYEEQAALKEQRAMFDAALSKLAQQFPQEVESMGLNASIDNDAIAIAQAADKRLGRLAGSREGVGKWTALISGGVVGAFRDPVNVASLFVGAGAGSGRTVGARVLNVALKEAAINGATEAAMQPDVQAWRKKAGLEYGFSEATKNVAFGALFGGVFGGGAGVAGEVARKFYKGAELDAVSDMVSDSDRIEAAVAAALRGDETATLEVLKPIKHTLEPEARGAIDHAEIVQHAETTRPTTTLERHETVLADAQRSIAADAKTREPFEPEIDREQVERIVADLVPDRAQVSKADREKTLLQFLIDSGGLKANDELDAIGASTFAEQFRGRLVERDGLDLDYAREAAAEAGYFDGKFGTPDEATAQATPQDLLDAMDQELRGNPVYPAGKEPDAEIDGDAERAFVEETVADVVRLAGPAVDDQLIRQAVELVGTDGLRPLEALDRVLVAADNLIDRTGTPKAGWTNDDLVADGDGRQQEPFPNGLEDPAAPDPRDIEIDEADFAEFADLPFPDDSGELVSLSAYIEDLDRSDNTVRLLEACRV